MIDHNTSGRFETLLIKRKTWHLEEIDLTLQLRVTDHLILCGRNPLLCLLPPFHEVQHLICHLLCTQYLQNWKRMELLLTPSLQTAKGNIPSFLSSSTCLKMKW